MHVDGDVKDVDLFQIGKSHAVLNSVSTSGALKSSFLQ